MAANDDYVRALRQDGSETDAYHRRAITKSEQQKFLETLLESTGRRFEHVADIACGGGALSFHLRALFPSAAFTLCDRDAEALRMAEELNGPNCRYVADDIHALSSLPTDSFDLVCCWQTLSWLKDPERAVAQLLRITRPGGLIMASSLFNLEHDVDIRSQMLDHTRPSGAAGHAYDYNTYSPNTVRSWLGGNARRHALHPFTISIDIARSGRGIGTYTVNTDQGRLQISGGLLMNWAILEVEK